MSVDLAKPAVQFGPAAPRAQAPAPCLACPWIHENSLLNSRTKAAAKRGDWFCCHKSMGTCYGAQMVGERLRARDAKRAASAANLSPDARIGREP